MKYIKLFFSNIHIFVIHTWKHIPNKGLWILSLLVIGVALTCILSLSNKSLDSVGNTFSAAAGFIAIIWFYNGLQLQTKQLEEQRGQFQLEFNNLKQESNRNAMLAAKNILDDMERSVVSKLGGEIETMPTLFLNYLQYLNPITKSDDPEVVLDAIQKISLFLVPARVFMYAMREAGRCVLENEGFSFVNTDLKTALASAPENYIRANHEHLMYRPFISKYIATAKTLADLMCRFKLDVITQAELAASELKNPKSGIGFMITDSVIKSMREFNRDANTPIITKYLQTIDDKK